MNIPDELKDMLVEPCKKVIAHFEMNKELLTQEERVNLEQLKFALKVYEIEKAFKEGRLKHGI